MRVKAAAAAVAAFFLLFAGVFGWAGLTGQRPANTQSAGEGPQAVLSERLQDGLIEADIYLGEALSFRIDLRFTPSEGSTISEATRPSLVAFNADMGMGDIEPALESLGQGRWRGAGSFPMAGRWIVSAGFGEEMGEVTVNAR